MHYICIRALIVALINYTLLVLIAPLEGRR